ncbi:hypothetical protein [Streptomyces ambofaciens]|uniref:hypothetical protein n=1 Tax=Streptomyces ambofaciens TaxID=1889 RepID=UPI00131E04A7|nr:hypothetical protein [Streptomyces ambofaciens]
MLKDEAVAPRTLSDCREDLFRRAHLDWRKTNQWCDGERHVHRTTLAEVVLLASIICLGGSLSFSAVELGVCDELGGLAAGGSIDTNWPSRHAR